MSNARFEKFYKQMIANGWNADGNPEAVVDENFGQFFTYWPHLDNMTMATISVDRYIQLREQISQSTELDFTNPASMAEGLGAIGTQLIKGNKRDKETEEMLGLMAALYMNASRTGRSYIEQAYGRPFAFLIIMYPSNKNCTDFYVRPSLMIGTGLMSVGDVYDMVNQVMEHDKASGKKEFFKYFKRKK